MEPQLKTELELRRAIRKLGIQNSDKKTFIPESALYALLPQKQISRLLSAHIPEHEIAEATNIIFQHGRKIIAILIEIELVSCITSFISHNIAGDTCLPLKEASINAAISCEEDAHQFYLQQWAFLAPAFTRRALWRYFSNDAILPITREEFLGSGGFGDVFEIYVEPSYNLFDDATRIVRKQFKRDISFKSFTEELENLSKLKHIHHPNIIPLLGCYTYGKEHNLVFPLATGGDLQKFLQQPLPPHFEVFENLLASIAGLSSGLATVHDFHSPEFHLKSIGCHRDLRPHNVLVNNSDFILTDFGLSRLRQHPETSQTLYKTGKGYYLAPECQSLEGDFPKHLVNRPSDIWSLGCMMLELWTHHLHGPQGVQDLSESRRFTIGSFTYRLFHCGTTANTGVLTWISQLESAEGGCFDSSSALFGQLIRNMLSMDPGARPTASVVAREIQYITLLTAAIQLRPLFQELSNAAGPDSFPIDLEKTRFESWLRGLQRVKSSDQKTGLVSEDTINELTRFKGALRCLHEIQDELCSVKDYSLDIKQESHERRHYSLRHLITTLLRSLPQTEQTIARNELENDLLLINDAELQKMHESLQYSQELRIAYSHLLFVAEMKISTATEAQKIQLNTDGLSKELVTWPTIDIERTSGHLIGSLPTADPYSPRCQVLIEKKIYVDHFAKARTQLKLNALCHLLSSEKSCGRLRVLVCRGFYHDPQSFSFGLVFDFPRLASPTEETKVSFTLGSILKKRSRLEKPTLRGRFQLASQLANALSDLHCMNWLHKNLSSTNVIFFNAAQAPSKDLSNPYLVGFVYSRPDEMILFSEGPPQPGSSYQSPHHPEYRSGLSYYSHEYDYYGLGLILLEIGLWAHLDDVTENCRGHKYDFVLQKKVPLLGAAMGTRYQDVVQQCLNGNFADNGFHGSEEQENETQAAKVKLCFRNVVARTLSQLAGFDI